MEQLTSGAADVNRLLTALEPVGGGASGDAVAAYEEFRRMRPQRQLRGALAVGRPVWAGLAAAAALVVVFAFAPARGWAQHVLEMLRVQNVTVVPVDMSELSNNSGRGKLAAQFLSDNVVVTMKPGEPVKLANVDAASAAAGYTVKALPGLEPSNISLSSAGAFHMALNRDRIEALLEASGRSDIPVPSGIDGSTLAVYIPKTVRLSYAGMDFTQVPMPVVSVPKTLNMAALAEAGLQMAGMNAAEAQAFCKGVDWTSTLVIPIPQGHSTYRTLAVDGVSGTLIEMQAPKGRQDAAVAMWVKNGMLYSLNGGDVNAVVAAAASLN
jgi:hypothetical protein